MQISPLIVNFFYFQNLDALYRAVAGKPFVLEDLCFGIGTSALTAETIFEIMKCILLETR